MMSSLSLTLFLAFFIHIRLSMALSSPQTINEYIVYPTNGLDPATNTTQAVLQKLQKDAPVVPYDSLYDGVIYWLTNCTAIQALHLETIAGVGLLGCSIVQSTEHTCNIRGKLGYSSLRAIIDDRANEPSGQIGNSQPSGRH